MRLIRGLVLFAIVCTGAAACFNPPDFPIEPQIEFVSIRYKEYGTGFDSEYDSLILTISFKDGDGDLGLAPSETKPPYNNKYYFQLNNGNLITYRTKRTVPGYDTLPAFVQPYNCINWEVYKENNIVKDTLYFQLNPDHNNIEVDFLVKNPNGTFTEFDWRKEFNFPNCGISFDGRFPILYKDRPGAPLEGRIRYGMGSIGFKVLFGLKTLKLRVQIKDRALNKSNIIETPEFTLQ
jgi:hypothetical protein